MGRPEVATHLWPPFYFGEALERRQALSHRILDWIALLVMAGCCRLYARWLWVTEPRRLERQAKARTMEQTYHHLESATAETLRSLLSEEIQTLRAAKRRYFAMLVITALFHLMAFLCVSHLPGQEAVRVALMLFIAWISAPLVFARYESRRISRKRVHAVVTRLHKDRARNNLGVLIEAMETGDVATTNLARLAVIAILPELTATDARALGSRHRAYLHQALRGSNSEFILAILHALEQVGDPTAIPYVKRLIPCPVWLWGSGRIEQAARKCLVALETRRDTLQTKQALLRAVVDPPSPANTLLRP